MSRRLIRLLVLLGLLAPWSSQVQADPVSAAVGNWTVDRGVFAVHRVGNTVYFGGDFTYVAPRRNNTGSFVVLSRESSGAVLTPRVSGGVETIVPDGSGGYFVGGRFSGVNGVARSNLAHIMADGSLDPIFAPQPNGAVNAMVMTGSTLYFGGDFTTVSGLARTRLAAVNLTNGTLTSWAPSVSGDVYTMLASGATIYVGGYFTQAAGNSAYQNAAAFSTAGVLVAGWRPAPNFYVFSMALSGTTIYMGGLFGMVGGQARGGLAAVSATDAALQPWAPAGFNIAEAVTVSGGTVFAGGTLVGGASVAAYNSVTGTPIWAVPGSPASALAVEGGQLYVGGSFTGLNGVERGHLAALSTATGAVLSFNPLMNNSVQALAITPAGLAAGGQFTAFNAVPRGHVAALDLSSDRLLPWNPNPDGPVYAITHIGGTAYIGGSFDHVGGQLRDDLAAVTLDEGSPLPWNPGANNTVSTLVPIGSSLIVGGGFSLIGGQARSYLAMLDAVTGVPSAWAPNPNNSPSSLIVSGSTAFVSGLFSTIGGQPRNRLAQIALTGSGLATAWNPSPNEWVLDMALIGSALYIAGDFTMVGGAARNHLAAVEAATGAVQAWNPNANARVTQLASAGSLLYLGGAFTTIAGQPRTQLAAIDLATGAISPWSPPSGESISALTADRDGAIVGRYRQIFGPAVSVTPFLEVFPEPLAATPGPPADVAAFSTGSTVSLVWSPPSAGGRPASYVLEAGSSSGASNITTFATGSAATSFSTTGVPPGTYYVRLRAANGAGTSLASDEVAFNVGAASCGTAGGPADFTASAAGNVVSFTWRAPPGRTPTAYVIEAGSSSGQANLARFDTGTSLTSLSLGAPPGVFYVRVRARDACGVSLPSNEAVVAVNAPAIPSGPLALSGTVTGNSVQLAWAPPRLGGVSTYVLEAGSGPGLSNVIVTAVGSGLTFGTTGVPNGVYYVRVRAVGPGGTSVPSNEVTLIVP